MNMKKLVYILFLTISIYSISTAQNSDKMRAANWCFGYGARIDFSSGSPVSTGRCELSTMEGVASISDTEGNLLLYSDGRVLYNGSDEMIGSGFGGDESSSQSAIILPVPESDSLYYLVTVDEIWEQSDPTRYLPPREKQYAYSGLCYSLIDITRNFGRGEVVPGEKNNLLHPKTCEKLTAIGHDNGKDYWVVSQAWGSNEFLVFLADENGITLSDTYPNTIFKSFKNPAHTKGYLKFSPDSRMLVSANNGVGLFLYSFDNKTGEISGEVGRRYDEFHNAYGVEFSPSGRFLYVSSAAFGDANFYSYESDDGSEKYGTDDTAFLFQLDLNAGDSAQVDASMHTIDYRYNGYTGSKYGALQIAIDGRIYFAEQGSGIMNPSNKYLNVIKYPDKKGAACGYSSREYRIENYYSTAYLGLPQMLQDYYKPQGQIIAEDCLGGTLILKADYVEGYKYKWKGPNGFEADTSYVEINPTTHEHEGRYILEITSVFDKLDRYTYDVSFLDPEISVEPAEFYLTPGQASGQLKTVVENLSPFDIAVDSTALLHGDKLRIISKPYHPYDIPSGNSDIGEYTLFCDTDTPGVYYDSLIVKITEPCIRIDTVPMIAYVFPKGEIIADKCVGGEIMLTAQFLEGYDYIWTLPDGTEINSRDHLISPSERIHSGTYKLKITSPDNISHTFTYEIEIMYVDLEIFGIEENFRAVPGELYRRNIEIRNNTEFPAVITNIEFLKGDVFRLEPLTLPFTVPGNSSSDDIEYTIFADEEAIYSDSLAVEVSSPCEAYFSKNGKAVTWIIKIFVRLPDTVADVGDVVRIPISARTDYADAIGETVDLDVSWNYFPEVYSAFNYQQFESEKSFVDSVAPPLEFVRGKFPNVILDTAWQVIGRINGTALLSDKVYTPLDIVDSLSYVSEAGYIIEGDDGSLSVENGTCLSKDLKVFQTGPHTVEVIPSPYTDDSEITLRTTDVGTLTLSVHSVSGELIEEFIFNHSGYKFEKTVRLDLSKYSAGVYLATWASNSRNSRVSFNVSK